MRAMGSIWTATFNFIRGSKSLGFAGLDFRCWRRMPLTDGAASAAGNQYCVKSQLEIGVFGMRHQPGLRCSDDALLLARGHRIGGLIETGARLDLDERQQIAPP